MSEAHDKGRKRDSNDRGPDEGAGEDELVVPHGLEDLQGTITYKTFGTIKPVYLILLFSRGLTSSR